jgi:hypothetical protein
MDGRQLFSKKGKFMKPPSSRVAFFMNFKDFFEGEIWWFHRKCFFREYIHPEGGVPARLVVIKMR